MIAAILAAASLAAPAAGVTPVVGGLESPLYVTAAPGDPASLYVVEQPGRIRVVRNGQIVRTFLDIRDRVASGGERGLLSVAFSPGYAKNHRFYVDYTDTNGNTRVVEFRSRNGVGVRSTARQLLFVAQPYPNHNGGQLEFDRQGYLYVGMGDGGSGGDPGNRAQNLSVRLGKLLRVNPARKGSAWQIVGYGLRNPWRFSFDRQTGDLWIGDVGQDHTEEVDVRPVASIGKLANYGWPKFEGADLYDGARPFNARGQLVSPVYTYPHSSGACSITGGYVYRGSSVPALAGRYVFGDYCNGFVWSGVASSSGLSDVRREPFRVDSLSSFGEDASGELYATSLNRGVLYKLTP